MNGTTIPAPPALAVGSFVREMDAPEWTLVVLDTYTDPKWGSMCKVRGTCALRNADHTPPGRSARGVEGWMYEERLIQVEVEPSTFPLEALPAHVLGQVVGYLPVEHALQLAGLSRRFRAACNDESVWRSRSLALLGPDAGLDDAPSWRELYRRHTVLHVLVKTVFMSWGSLFVTSEFAMRVPAFMTVLALKHHVAEHPANPNRSSSGAYLPVLEPFDPRAIRNAVASAATINCSFNDEDEYISIWDAGLRDGSVLQQRDLTRCD